MAGMSVRIRRTCDAARASAHLARDDRLARNAAVWEAYSELGWTMREISREGKISISQVQRIIDQETARRQQRMLRAVP